MCHKGFIYYINEAFAFCRVLLVVVDGSILVADVVLRWRFWVGGWGNGVK